MFCKPILAILLQRKRHISHMHHACSLFFVNLTYAPKRRFWNDEQKVKCGFSKLFSMVRKPILAILLPSKHIAIFLQRKHQTIINASRVFVVFCKPILAILLQRKLQTIACISLTLVVFCKPILVILLQRKRLIDRTCWLCFVNPSLQYYAPQTNGS